MDFEKHLHHRWYADYQIYDLSPRLQVFKKFRTRFYVGLDHEKHKFTDHRREVFVGDELLQRGQSYPTTFVTKQGVAPKYGRNRQQHTERSIDALRAYLDKHRPLRAELRGTFAVV